MGRCAMEKAGFFEICKIKNLKCIKNYFGQQFYTFWGQESLNYEGGVFGNLKQIVLKIYEIPKSFPS